MEADKAELMDRPGITNQESLVKALMSKTVKPIKYKIPGGKSLHEQLDKKTLVNACYTWLRHCESFNSVTVSLTSDPDQYKADKRKIQDFNPNDILPEWMANPEGRKWLAEQVVHAMVEFHPVAIYVDTSGISVKLDPDAEFSPKSDDWEPYIEFIPRRRAQYGR